MLGRAWVLAMALAAPALAFVGLPVGPKMTSPTRSSVLRMGLSPPRDDGTGAGGGGRLPRRQNPISSERGGAFLLPGSTMQNEGSNNMGSAHEQANVLSRKVGLSATCNLCETRSMYKITRKAYREGIVFVWCKGCGQKHLIADATGRMNFPEFGHNIEEYMARQGTPVKRVSFTDGGIRYVTPLVPGVHYPRSGKPADADPEVLRSLGLLPEEEQEEERQKEGHDAAQILGKLGLWSPGAAAEEEEGEGAEE